MKSVIKYRDLTIVLFCKYIEEVSNHDCDSYVILNQLRERYSKGRVDHEGSNIDFRYITVFQSKSDLCSNI